MEAVANTKPNCLDAEAACSDVLAPPGAVAAKAKVMRSSCFELVACANLTDMACSARGSNASSNALIHLRQKVKRLLNKVQGRGGSAILPLAHLCTSSTPVSLLALQEPDIPMRPQLDPALYHEIKIWYNWLHHGASRCKAQVMLTLLIVLCVY